MKANDDNMNDLELKFDQFQKQCEQMQDDLLNQMRNFIQNFQSGPPGEDKEHEATTDTELFSTEDIHPLAIQEPPRESDICQLIEECCVEASDEEKQKMEDTMLDLVKICHHKQFLCIHDDVDDLMESALDSKLLSINSINSQRLDKKEQEIKIVVEQPTERRNHAEKSLQNFRVIHKSPISLNSSQISSIHEVAPILSTKEPENSLSMGYEHLSITPETESDEVTESNAENLLPIPNECEVALEDKRECDLLISENSPVCDNSATFSDSEINDDISVYDDDFKNIEYVEASLSDPEIVKDKRECDELICENSSTIDVCDNHSETLFDSNNDDLSSDDKSFEDIEYVDASVPNPAIVSVEEENVEEVDLEYICQVQDVVLREKLFSIIRLISNIESLNDNSTPDRVLNSFESDNSLLDNYSLDFETFCDHSEETRSGNTTHANYSLPEYDSFCFEIKPDQERLINLMKNDISDSSNDPLLEEANLFLFDNSIPPGIKNVVDDPEGDIRFLEELLIDDT
nr:hypothetical protein [Tanacetum cinerariifolium]